MISSWIDLICRASIGVHWLNQDSFFVDQFEQQRVSSHPVSLVLRTISSQDWMGSSLMASMRSPFRPLLAAGLLGITSPTE